MNLSAIKCVAERRGEIAPLWQLDELAALHFGESTKLSDGHERARVLRSGRIGMPGIGNLVEVARELVGIDKQPQLQC
ncbi:MAG: hypothetical protein ICV72_07670 [Aldersonia sp.]|nr:hypothetical protein [Aldersonia sp.]